MPRLTNIVLIIFLLATGSLCSQIVVDNTLTVEQYVQDVLLGSGVAVSNITFNGQSADQVFLQIGSFDGTNCNVGIESGLVIGSGAVSFVEGPNNSTGFTGESLGLNNSTDPDLTALIPGFSVNDWSILEFDFVPNGDTLSFNYVWGSEEYMEWVNSSFNDVFGFFLSGPGINGPYSNDAENIAVVPGTSLPVTIDNLNLSNNGEYYVDNESEPNYQTDEYYIQLDGFTVPLQAMAIVECGAEYHIKIAIADAGDTILDSAVFLEEGSFSSNSVVSVDLSIDVGPPEAELIYEDCGLATITFTRSPLSDLSVEDMVVVTWGGTAENGVDYTEMPEEIIFPPGEMTVSFEIDAFEDGVLEGLENVYLDILNIAACNGDGLVTNFEFFIDDEPLPLVVDGFSQEICQGDTLTIEPTITGGYGNFSFDWDTGESTQSIDVSPWSTTTYNVIVSDTCGMPSDDADIIVQILEYPPLEVVIDQGDILLECNETIQLTATASGGDGNYSNWSWFDENGIDLWGFDNSVWYSTWQGADEIFVSVQDGCGFTATNNIDVSVNVPQLFVDVVDELEINCGDDISVTASASGGEPGYTFNWYDNGNWIGWGQTLNYTPNQPGPITVDVQDACGQSVAEDVNIVILSPPIELEIPESYTGSCAEEFSLEVTVLSGSGGYSYSWAEGANIVGSGNPLSFSSEINTSLIVTVEDQCGQQASVQTQIFIENPPLEIELGENINASCIDNNLLTVDILSGSGGYVYQWYIEGELVGDEPTLSWQTYETVDVSVNVNDGCGGTDSDGLTIFIPNIPVEVESTPAQFICPGDEVTLNALAEGGEGGFVYYWPELDEYGQSVSFTPYTNAEFTVIATDICGEYETSVSNVNIVDIEVAFSATYIDEFNIQFTPLTSENCEGCIFFWDFDDGATSYEMEPIHAFEDLGQHNVELVVVSPHGCMDNAFGIVHGPPNIYIPNSFSPNNDGVNDIFQVVADQLLSYEFQVFNRWGEVVFESEDPNDIWNGNHVGGDYFVQNGVYLYTCKIKGYNSDAVEYMGTITVLR